MGCPPTSTRTSIPPDAPTMYKRLCRDQHGSKIRCDDRLLSKPSIYVCVPYSFTIVLLYAPIGLLKSVFLANG